MTATDTAPFGQTILDDEEPQPGDLRLWSVTTVLDQISKPALEYWAARQTARAALAQERTWQAMRADAGDVEAVKWLAGARYRPAADELAAKDLGSVVHMCTQHFVLAGARPDHDQSVAIIRSTPSGQHLNDDGIVGELAMVARMLERFDGWCQRFTPTFTAAEVVVYHPTYGYAGTLDLFATVDAVRFLIDEKTSREPLTAKGKPKVPYPETVLQLAAYRYSEFAAVWNPRRMSYQSRRYYLLGPAERALAVPVPDVDAAGCLFITPERCELHPMRANPRAHQAFLHVLEVARWTLQDFRGAIGDPIVPPTTESDE